MLAGTPNVFQERYLSKRELDSNGCVTNCPRLPDCICPGKNEQCVQIAATCEKCAYNQCTPISSSTVHVGGVVGGVVGGLIVAALAGCILYYFLVYKKKHPVTLDEEYDYYDNDTDEYGGKGSSESVSGDEEYSLKRLSSAGVELQQQDEHQQSQSLSPLGEGLLGDPGKTSKDTAGGTASNSQGSSQYAARPNARRAGAAANNSRKTQMKRISSYESFTRPSRSKQQKQLQALQRRARQKTIVEQANQQRQQQQQQQQQSGATQLYMQPGHRDSVATSFSNASNILPIAYIPGVTVRPSKNNTGSIYSNDSDSLFSDMNAIENASIVGDVVRASKGSVEGQNNHHHNNNNIHNNNNNNNNTSNTNLRQVPEEQSNDGNAATMTAIKAQPRLVNVDRIEEEEEEDEEEDDDYDYENYNPSLHGVGIQNGAINEETDDSDVDSDIGQITRATSTRTNKGRGKISRISRISRMSGTSATTSDGASFATKEILMDSRHETNASGTYIDETLTSMPIELVTRGVNFANRDSRTVDWENGSTVGSFLFDVEFDGNRPMTPPPRRNIGVGDDDASSVRSPFEDP
ncbi:uncharacterized protein LODBEIA_P07150 [Lodderomyces beijingensis]|uniref:Membrane anchor Opy2 N-terminal domain-containing protein n=1 Tax=Lodderomyces beijingensis TaxID=1775926 RepID=A0ABP0ZEA2_9ASCO